MKIPVNSGYLPLTFVPVTEIRTFDIFPPLTLGTLLLISSQEIAKHIFFNKVRLKDYIFLPRQLGEGGGKKRPK